MTKKYSISLICISIVSIIVLAISISYAYWRQTLVQNGINEISSGCFNIELIEDQNEIYIEEMIPITDSEGRKLTPFTFRIKNNCDIKTDYTISLEMLSDSTLPTKFVDIVINDGTTKKLSSLKEGIKNDSSSVESRVIDSGKINKDEVLEYSIRLWLDHGVTLEDNTQNTILKAKIVVSGEPAEISKFEIDSWETIANNVKSGNIPYKVGETKEVDMGEFGKHIVRVANTSACTNGETSETACDFIVKFADIITTGKMNDNATSSNPDGSNTGGWRDSEMRTYLNDTILKSLPEELQNVITDTYVVSSNQNSTTKHYYSTDKLYLLSGGEVFGTNTDDKAIGTSKQLDIYSANEVTTTSYKYTRKKYNNNITTWLLRSATIKEFPGFSSVTQTGSLFISTSNSNSGISPAFRIGLPIHQEEEETQSQFEIDSWETIAANVKSGTYPYQVGDTKKITIASHNNDCYSYSGYGSTYTCLSKEEPESEVVLRVANTSACTNGETSETACGFVVEFYSTLDTYIINPAGASYYYGDISGGWRDSKVRTYINTTIFESLPIDLQNVIADTYVVSANANSTTEHYYSTDKLYLLSGEEVYGSIEDDKASGTSRQLDYYVQKGVTKTNYIYNAKGDDDNDYSWWLRTSKIEYVPAFLYVQSSGALSYTTPKSINRLSPAFRIN